MTDIHTHVLPGVDDGAQDLEDSLAMLRMAAAAGTTDIVATSHSDPDYIFDPCVAEEKVAQLQSAIGDTIRVHYGCEMHLTLENIENVLRSPEEYSICHKGYLLVEFSNFVVPKSTSEILGRMLDRGLRPIIAHPERNPILRSKMEEVENWVSLGCSLQVTGQSLLGRFGKSARKSSLELMSRGLVHFLASDAHDLLHRPPVLDEVRKHVEENFDAEIARMLLVENPQAVVQGLAVALCPPVPKKRPWYALW